MQEEKFVKQKLKATNEMHSTNYRPHQVQYKSLGNTKDRLYAPKGFSSFFFFL